MSAEITEADRERAAAFLASPAAGRTALEGVAQLLADQRDSLSTEHRAVLVCTQDPCSYCYGPARRIVLDPSFSPFATAEAAREHGRLMARNVYGGEHRALVEARTVGSWTEVAG